MTGFLWGEDADTFFSRGGNSESKKKSTKGAGPASEANRDPTGEPSAKEDEGQKPLSVTQLNAWIKRTLDQSLTSFWVAGEVGSITRSGAGHIYLTLKDNANQISAVLWKSTWEKYQFDLREGLSVLCMGRIDVYGPRGTYQIVVQRIEPQGIGALQLAFRRLHAKLEAEGLFRSERKRPLPRFPKRVGFVTSPHGAAIHDFLEVLRRRWPQTSVLVIPAKVQGAGSAEQIARGIELAAQVRPKLDVLIVGRGGGSIEDLWSFNEELVVRAIAACPIPTVSAVGHEIDVTLCDLAADVRALTPSEAAELVVPNRDEIIELLFSVQSRIRAMMQHKIRELETRWTGIASRPIFQQPQRVFDTMTQRLDDLERRLLDGVDKRLERAERSFEILAAQLESVSPLRTLARGYSFTTDAATGHVLTDIQEARVGQVLRTRIVDGTITSEVISLD